MSRLRVTDDSGQYKISVVGYLLIILSYPGYWLVYYFTLTVNNGRVHGRFSYTLIHINNTH